MVYNINLAWKDHNVNLGQIVDYAKSIDPTCCGASANTSLQIHFTSQPSETTITAIQNMWDSIDEDHDIAASYKSRDEVASDQAKAKESATNKLRALGLTDDEIAALKG